MLPHSAQRRGSVIVIVMVTLIFATFALVTFMEKANVDLLVEQRYAVDKRLRMEAYSALETTLGVLEVFREAGQGLRSPADGWSDPLGFAGYSPSEGRTVEVTFEDESGKISLPRVTLDNLVTLFEGWGFSKNEAGELGDALLGWMKRDHIYATVQPTYDSGALPFESPNRPLRSFSELLAIEKVRDKFFDEEGRPNGYWMQFTQALSLFDFQQPNINGAREDTLSAIGGLDEQARKALLDQRASGRGSLASPGDAQTIAGPGGNLRAFGATISALKVIVTVREGNSEFKVAAVVAPQGSSARAIRQTATRKETSSAAAKTSSQNQSKPDASKAGNQNAKAGQAGQGQNQGLRYPFTLLEIRENADIPSSPAPIAQPTL